MKYEYKQAIVIRQWGLAMLNGVSGQVKAKLYEYSVSNGKLRKYE